MNQRYLVSKILYGSLAGIIGGTMGWLIADYLLWKSGEIKAFNLSDDEPVIFEDAKQPARSELAEAGAYSALAREGEEIPGQIDYARRYKATPAEKGKLDELVRAYTPPRGPHLITVEEWNEDDEYDKLSIVFYSGDGVYADDMGTVLDDDSVILSPDFKPSEHFGEQSGDNKLVYVRNTDIKTDFEVTWAEAAYVVIIGGMSEEEFDAEKGVKKEPVKRSTKPKAASRRRKASNNDEKTIPSSDEE